MNTVKIRNVEIGSGIPKICVPIIGSTRKEILSEAAKIKETDADIAEWRADWYEDVFEFSQTAETARRLRDVLGEMPLLFTFRTAREGGEKEIAADIYADLNKHMIKAGYIDLIDVEAFTGDEAVQKTVACAHEHGVRVIISNHDFHKTPEKAELISRLRKMQNLGADIPKIAVMPQNTQDVLTLLAATEEMRDTYADRPIITMSMAGTGLISRLCGELFGSALTFGTAGKASAPGQIPVRDLKSVLDLLHSSLSCP